MKKIIIKYSFKLYAPILIILHLGCGNEEKSVENIRVKAPVEITKAISNSFSLSKSFKGTTYYLTSGDIKSPIIGYITKVYVKIGDNVRKGDPLFALETKEAYVLKGKNYLNDPTLKDIGKSIIRAPENGYITSVLGEESEYVQEGTLLGNYSAPDMFVFLLEVPAEQDSTIIKGKACIITLPNGKSITGKLGNSLSSADSLSQTEKYIVVPDQKIILPARLQITVSFEDYNKKNVLSLPKSAILSDEIQSQFWVMKLVNDSTAVKVPVRMGLENETQIEILEPVFASGDRIISKGGYGLSDTALVEIKK